LWRFVRTNAIEEEGDLGVVGNALWDQFVANAVDDELSSGENEQQERRKEHYLK